MNAIVAFEAAARLGSLTLASHELYVTPGAVSRRVKLLEEALDATLFIRSNNTIELTDAGRSFLKHVTQALAILRQGAREVSGRSVRLSIRAPLTLTQRWLIPRIESFRQAYPGIDLRFQTMGAIAGERADIEIQYARSLAGAAEPEGVPFLEDRAAPICTPRFLATSKQSVAPADVLPLTLLQDTADGWSWRQWCKVAGIDYAPEGDVMVFDTDEAAIDACFSGLGVAQANLAFVSEHVQAGTLRQLTPGLEATLGVYYASIRVGSLNAQAFMRWLREQGQPSQSGSLGSA
ncbi:LysR family transcriptional regulator [Nitratireductor aquibiodomus RA22]|uniref:LysR family transcriptional regulator n=1 Tax=Nitratireductor aquibiodomus RA22 TaxID=1189611 RepID=I5C577_9HYPH|nr:LysR family transcriptional regulator [Nitratireductor aquibiodomus RA22]